MGVYDKGGREYFSKETRGGGGGEFSTSFGIPTPKRALWAVAVNLRKIRKRGAGTDQQPLKQGPVGRCMLTGLLLQSVCAHFQPETSLEMLAPCIKF